VILAQSAVVLIQNPKGLILTVSRKDNADMIGLPGGKVDPSDCSLVHTAQRELLEETGLSAVGFKQVFRDMWGPYDVTCFTATAVGNINTRETGVVRWSRMQDLIDRNRSPFANYNQRLFMELGII
jgi:8-oxo-dGTP pyrophosphatase MutT (NUDIX family)